MPRRTRNASREDGQKAVSATATRDALTEREAPFRAVLESMSEGVMIFDAGQNLIYQNPASLRIHGFIDQAAGHLSHDMLPRTWKAWDETGRPLPFEKWPVSRVLRGERFQGQVLRVVRVETGREFLGSYNGSPILDADGRLSLGFITIRDITQQFQAQEALRLSEERFRRALDIETVGVVFWGKDLTITGCNETFLRLTGLTREEAAGKSWRELTAPEFHAVSESVNAERMATGYGRAHEKQYFRKDGTRWWGLSAAQKLNDDEAVEFVADITERKRAEENLRKSEAAAHARAAEVAAIMDAMPLITFIAHDREARQMTSSRAGYELLRVSPGANTSKSAPAGERPEGFRTFAGGRELKPEELPVQRAAATGQEVRGAEIRLVFGDGTWRQIFGDAVPLFDESGQPRGAVGGFADITQLKLAEQALRDSEEQFRAIFESSSDCILVWDRDYNYLYANQAAIDHVGTTRDRVIGKNIRDGLGHVPDFMRLWMGRVDRAFATGEPFRVEDTVRVGDKVVHSESQISPIRNTAGRVFAAGVVYRDVTDRKHAEEAVRQSEEKYRTLFESIDQGFCTIEVLFDENQKAVDYRFLTVNPAFERQTGIREAVGRRMREVAPLHEEYWFEIYGRVVLTGEPIRFENATAQLGRFYEVYAFRIGPPAEHKVAVLFNDVTARKQAEAVLARDKAELERLVAERTMRLQELVADLEHFSYTITHDMRAPLRAMLGFAELLNELNAENPEPQQQEFLRRISASARRMDLLITDALNFSRVVRQQMPLETVDTGALLRGMLDTYPELQPSRAHIHVEGRLPAVLGNEAGLTQCFSNLLGNAVKFVKSGRTPEVRIRAEEVLLNGQPWARLWVEDDGIGVSKELLPRMFEMFTRGSPNYEGTGIGLALVRKVVQRMGGRVGVHSEEGKGSRFWLELKKVER